MRTDPPYTYTIIKQIVPVSDVIHACYYNFAKGEVYREKVLAMALIDGENVDVDDYVTFMTCNDEGDFVIADNEDNYLGLEYDCVQKDWEKTDIYSIVEHKSKIKSKLRNKNH